MLKLISCVASAFKYSVNQIAACKVTITVLGIGTAAITLGALVPMVIGAGILLLGAVATSAVIIDQFWGNFTPMFILLLLGISVWPLAGLCIIFKESIGAIVFLLSAVILRSTVDYEVTLDMWAGLVLVLAIPWLIISTQILSIGIAWLVANSIIWVGIPLSWGYTQWVKVNRQFNLS